ncbi:MAG: hypothetical protein K9K30_01085 [Burkholderiaceae bacterium]|nr:hypothetical protein [Sulfuritalea sp.]MCF8173823.1 hypothetical protein [Burkholderiaceae bacterium]
MNTEVIYCRTEKGEREAVTGGHALAPDVFRLLQAIDGSSTVESLRGKLGHLSAEQLEETLDTLAGDDFIEELESPTSENGAGSVSSAAEAQRRALALRAKIKARREKADRLTPEADAGESQGKLATQDENEARAREEAESKLQREAEDRAREEAAANARREAEERARQEAEAKARREAAALVQQEAEAAARRQAEEQARFEVEERARQEAELRDRLAAEDAARQAEEEKNRKSEKKAKARKRSKDKSASASASGNAILGWLRAWGRGLAFGLVALVAIGLGLLHLISFDGQIPRFEKALTGQFQQPVKIKALHLSLLPRPHLRLEDVSVGAAGQIRVSRIKAMGSIGNLFSDSKVFNAVELDSLVLDDEALGWVLFGKPLARDVLAGQISVLNAKLESKYLSLPDFSAVLKADDGGVWTSIALESLDKSFSLKLAPQGEKVQLAIDAKSFKVPFGAAFTLEDWVAKGAADRNGIVLSEFKGFVIDGFLSGDARLEWGANWSLSGDLQAKQMDAALLAPGALSDARLAGTAKYAMQAQEAAKLFAAPRLEGTIVIPRGTLLGVDIGRLLQGRGTRGTTRFVDLGANFVHERGATQLRQLRFGEGAMSASGTVDIDADSKVRGRLAVDLKLGTDQRRANLALSGTAASIEWR